MKELQERQQQVLQFYSDQQDSEGLGAHIEGNRRSLSVSQVLMPPWRTFQALLAKGVLKNLPGTRPVASAPWIPLHPKIASAESHPGADLWRNPPPVFPKRPRRRKRACVLIDVKTSRHQASARTFGLKVRGGVDARQEYRRGATS